MWQSGIESTGDGQCRPQINRNTGGGMHFAAAGWLEGGNEMDLKEYFEANKGLGVLATADSDGLVDAAVYARPHVMDDGSLAMIMRDRLTHHNLQSNPHATYLFVESGPGYKGKRLFLTKLREEKNSDLLQQLKRRQYLDDRDETRFLVFFRIDKELPLVGSGDK